MRSRNKLTQLLALFLALLTVVSVCPLSVSAESGFYEEGDADYDSGGGTATDTSGEFNLSYTDDVAKQIVGYRITGIKANGEKQADNSTDVYITNAQYIIDKGQSAFETKFEGSSIYVSMNQYCKREFYLAESSNSALADGTITSKSNYVYEWNCSLNGNIPTTEAEFDVWQKKTGNDEDLAQWAGYSSKAAMKNGDKIIVEPIYIVNNLQSKTCFLTVSEIANFGQSWYGGSSNGWNNTGASGNGSGTFGFISSYTNRKWPNAFYTKDGMGLWEGAEAISESTTKRETFNNLLLKGYGVIILYDEPTLPDLYVESIKFYTTDGQEQMRTALPLNRTIYVIATFKAATKENKKANFFGGNLSGDRTGRGLNVSTEMKVATGSIGMSSSFGVRYSIYDSVTMTSYPSSTSSNRYEHTMINGGTVKVRIGTLNSTNSSDCGYYHAAIYLNDKTSATSSDETNTSNNYMKVSYDFASDVERDLELSSIVLKLNGTTLSGDALKSIPFGAMVDVYHTYKSNSKSDGIYMSEPYCVTLSGTDSDPRGMVMCQIDGSFVHETSSFYTTDKVGSFRATSLIDAERYGGIYLKSDYNYDAAEETNPDNNKKHVTWRAKCDIQVYQIILKDADDNVLGTYTRGGTNTAPTLKQGQKVYVYYKYKNTSAGDIVANGHRSKSATSNNLTVSKVTIPANGTITKYSHSFTVGSEQSGKVSGAVYVDKDKYDITSSSSVTYTGCETNSANNTLEMEYDVARPIDLKITKIQYQYTKDGVSYTETVNYAERNTKVVEIPYGVDVYVWYTFMNDSEESVEIDGYYCYNATGNPGTLMSDTRTDYNANGVTLGAGDDIAVCSGCFTASTFGEAYYYGAVFKDGKTDAIGEKDTTNNTMTAKYRVVGYDVGITDIYYKDSAGNEYGRGSSEVTLNYGETYDIYYTIRNNGTYSVHVNIYNNVDPNAEGAVCVTPVSYLRDGGVNLASEQEIDVPAGQLTPAEQVIGKNTVDGSVFIGGSTSVDFTYGEITGTETNATNNTRVETVTLKFDVAITNIYFTTTDGSIQMKPNANGVITVPANVELIRYYVLKNNTAAPINVNIYYEADGIVDPIFDGPNMRVITLAAGEEKAVATGRMGFTVSSGSSTTTKAIKGHVYRDGQEIKGDSDEITFDNNVYEVTVMVYKTPYLTAIAPNASYRVGTDVITSFYLHNPTATHYTGRTANNTLKVTFTVKSLSGNVLYTVTQDAIVPALCEGSNYPASYKHGFPGGAQLVFFKWSLPEEYTQSMVVVEAKLSLPNGLVTTNLSNSRSVCSNEVMNTPDTQYEAKPPANWNTLVNANAPFGSGNNSRSWYIYTYTGGRFIRNYYYYSVSAKNVYMNPISATTEYNGSNFFMRSGYGVKLTAYGIDFYKQATASMYTDMQYAYATWQEFGYSTDEGKITTLEKVGNQWQLPEYLDYVNDDGTGKRIHFTPIWYPNRDYSAYVCFSDIWTPMGMITAARESNEIQIRDDMYEDWYIGHG